MYGTNYEYHDRIISFKSGSWGGVQSKGEADEANFYQEMFLYSDLLKVCLKEKHNITKFFNMIMFLDENNSRYKVMG